MFRTYYQLAKPGIVYGNALTAVAGFLLGAQGSFSVLTLMGFVVGHSLAIAGACVFNNVMDRDIDAHMERTKNRALVTGEVLPQQAVLYASVLTAVGLVLLIYTSWLACLLTIIGIALYLGAYTPAKRRTSHSTLIGALAGAVPPVAGYAASTGRLDLIALALFLSLASWQMPHFFAIALYRVKEYAAAGLPILSVSKGAARTHQFIILYIFVFVGASGLLGYLAALSPWYFLILGTLSTFWLILALASKHGASTKNGSRRAARRVFLFSLVILFVFSALISFA